MQLGEVIDKLYASEINCSVSSFWDGGLTVKLGDEMNGFVAEAVVKSSEDAAVWLDAAARKYYPSSVYAGGHGQSSESNGIIG